MIKLYELRFEYDAIMARIEAFAAENEGLIPDELEEELSALGGELDDKLLNCGLVYKNLAAEAAAIREEERRLTARRKVAENAAERFKSYIAANVPEGYKNNWPQLAISSRRSEAVEVTDELALPDEYKRIKVEADKTAIKAAIKAGGTVQGAQIVERFSLQIK
jgi:hypothetical protein